MFKVVLAGLAIAASAAPTLADPGDTDERECPTEVRGVRIASSVLRDGVAFTFTVAKPGQLSALRSLLREAASILEHDSKIAALHPDPDIMPASDGSGSIPALDISVRNTPTGAIVSVRPEEEKRIGLIQQNARSFELFWSTHDCVDTPRMANPAVTSEKAVASSPRREARSKATRAR
jgi:hypothetical protein